MAKFSYQAITESGATVSGVLEAESSDAASNVLLQQGYIPSRIRKQWQLPVAFQWRRLRGAGKGISTRELILFTRQFRTMIRAGVPMRELLETLKSQSENPKLKRIIDRMVQDISQGASYYEAFRKHPHVFSPLYASIIQAGEKTDALASVLDRLIYIMEHEEKIRSEVKSALRYPLFVIMFLIFAFFVLLIFVIPKFVKVFQMRGIDLPLPTRVSLLLYHFFLNYWYIGLFLGITGTVFLISYFRTEQGRYVWGKILLGLPVFGSLFVKASMSRFASLFSILQFSGVPVLDAIKILATTMDNTAFSRELEQIGKKIEEGSPISAPLRSARYFTPMVVNMVSIGEKTEKLDEMLKDIAQHYDTEIEYTMKGITESIGPVLTIGIAFVIGFFMLAIFLPMWDMTKTL